MADSDNNRIVKYDQDTGGYVAIAGNHGAGAGSNQLSTPYGSFLDGNQTVYVADHDNQRIQKWAAGGINGVTVAGVTGAGGSSLMHLNGPSVVQVDNNG